MRYAIGVAVLCASGISAQPIDWSKTGEEGMRHFQSLVQIDSTGAPGTEAKVAKYVKKVLEAEGISVTLVAQDPARPNLIARIKGNGSKKPLLIMGHSDTVKVDLSMDVLSLSATRYGGYVKRTNARLDRDVILVSEAGEEGNSRIGIGYLVNDHFPEIEASTESGRPAPVWSPKPSGHGSRPMRGNAIAHLSGAVEKLACWDTPMRLNDTTRTFFEKMGQISEGEEAKRFKDLLNPEKSATVREYLAVNEPGLYSMLHTSISPNIIQGGFQSNVIPSEATATLDIRALPDENMPEFYERMRKVINDPAVEFIPNAGGRPQGVPISITSDVFKALEASFKTVYGVPTVPLMGTGATHMSQLRPRGVQRYGIGAMRDDEDVLKGFGAHSDHERISEESVYKHLKFYWNAVTAIAGAKF